MTAATPWLEQVRTQIDARLASHFARARSAVPAPEADELVEAVERLTMRGGKRLRPALTYAAHAAVIGDVERPDLDPPVEDVFKVGAALELLQSYLLIHDDWMDGDEERRGGPSVHAALRDAHAGDAHLGASLAVLAGNLASAHAWELLTSIEGPEARLRAVMDAFLVIHRDVMVGQQLDLMKTANVPLMQKLKTGSYTVRGPLMLGWALGRGDAAARDALERYGEPLGEAFQLRDDVLGTFGERTVLGKPVGGDLRAGKRTALIRAAEESGAELGPLTAVLGVRDASDEDVARATDVLVRCGAKASVEGRIDALLGQARAALTTASLHEAGVAMLSELADRLAVRSV
jgi:geranylgeranyl diphosphate synthase type I